MRFLLLCAAAALQLAAFPACEAFADQTASGVRVEIPAKVEERLEIMRLFSTIDRECSRLLKTPAAALHPLRIELLPDADDNEPSGRFAITRRGGSTVLTINGNYADFMLDREPLLVVTGVFLLSKCGLDPARHYRDLPLFAAAGVAENVLQRHLMQTRRLPVRVQTFPAIRRMFLLTGGFDLRRMTRIGSVALQIGGGAYGIFSESSRMAVELLSGGATTDGGSALAELIRRTADGETPDSAFTAAFARILPANTVNDDDEADAAITAAIYRRVFTPNNPFPPSEQRRQLAEVRQVAFTAADGTEVAADLTELPRLIARYGEEALELRDRKRAAVAVLMSGADALTAPAFHALTAALDNANSANPNRRSRELAEALTNAEAAVAGFELMELHLSEAEAAFVPARALYKYSFEELLRSRNTLPANVLRALDAAEKKLERR